MYKCPRVLIVGTVPYDPNTSSRAFDAYFHNWDPLCLRQIFSDPNSPLKGHCSSLFQITDKMMLSRRFKRKAVVGERYDRNDLPTTREEKQKNNEKWLIKKLYKLGKKKSSLNRLARKWLWKEKYWNTEELRNWLDEFNPECVFLAFSDDFFINEIALFVADRYNIPIMTCIGDDYYFNDKKSISLPYLIYRSKYKKLINRVFSHKCSAIYISDKIRDKYNKEFSIKGDTVYLSSDVVRKKFQPINDKNPVISYCGNIRLGRNSSLVEIAKALYQIDPAYKLDVYSAENDKKYINAFRKIKNIVFHGRIPYSDVLKTFDTSDIVLIVEGFLKKDVNLTRYSLSTKAADSITSGCHIISYGSEDCGVIEYMKKCGCAMVCTDQKQLVPCIKNFLKNADVQEAMYRKSYEIMKTNHNLEESNRKTKLLFKELLCGE